MNSTSLAALSLLAVLLVACGASPPAEGDPGPADPHGSDPGGENVAAPAPCPLFCTRDEAAACTRPDVDDVSDAACGVMARLAGAPREACPDHCCRPTEGSGSDTDADGLIDASDRCPNEPEDVEGYEDQDGCPDADNDGDGIEDYQDICCFAAEDADGEQDEDGCPE